MCAVEIYTIEDNALYRVNALITTRLGVSIMLFFDFEGVVVARKDE